MSPVYVHRRGPDSDYVVRFLREGAQDVDQVRTREGIDLRTADYVAHRLEMVAELSASEREHSALMAGAVGIPATYNHGPAGLESVSVDVPARPGVTVTVDGAPLLRRWAAIAEGSAIELSEDMSLVRALGVAHVNEALTAPYRADLFPHDPHGLAEPKNGALGMVQHYTARTVSDTVAGFEPSSPPPELPPPSMTVQAVQSVR